MVGAQLSKRVGMEGCLLQRLRSTLTPRTISTAAFSASDLRRISLRVGGRLL